MSISKPNFREELKLYKSGYGFVAGVDEAGRGPIAGNITAAAVIFPAKFKIPRPRRIRQGRRNSKFKNVLININDSKKLTPAKREELYKILTAAKKIKWAVASVSEKVIDKINIYKATRLAMRRAIKKLKPQPDFVIFDGPPFYQKRAERALSKYAGQYKNKKYKYDKKFIIKADEKVMSCAAASIIAKVTRDRAMLRLHGKYPQYGFDKHKGYGTKSHFRMLKRYGPCGIHRRSFEPVKSLVSITTIKRDCRKSY